VNFGFGSKLGRCYRCCGASVLVVLATVACGCGSSGLTSSSNPVDAKLAGKAPSDLLRPDQMYKYEGTGTAKRKVEISRKERMKLMREAVEKAN
jgi:hypothetical protein